MRTIDADRLHKSLWATRERWRRAHRDELDPGKRATISASVDVLDAIIDAVDYAAEKEGPS